ncbi:Protein PRRC1, partial [Stegodyphus mimosarum]
MKNMMEEVNDDTNGESTFEFVDGKVDESQKDDNKSAMSGSVFPPNSVETSTVLTSSDQSQTLPVTQSHPFPAAESKDVQPILFYDPSQHHSNAMFLPPLSDTPVNPSGPPPMPEATQSQYATLQQGYSASSALSQSTQASPVPQSYVEPPIQQHSALVLPLPLDDSGNNLQERSNESSVWGWLKGKDFLNKVAEKAKSSVDSVITTLDPGMKEIINTGGDISVVVASGNEVKVSAVREAFQLVFGKATVQGVSVQASSIAPQPVGFSAGLRAAEERINNLRLQGLVHDSQVLISIENFLTELTPENWFDIGCLLLQDYQSGISLQVYTEAIPIPSHFVLQAKDQTPADYPLGWSGYKVTIGQILGSAYGVHHGEWHQALTGVSRREILFLAAKTIAGLYKAQLKR